LFVCLFVLCAYTRESVIFRRQTTVKHAFTVKWSSALVLDHRSYSQLHRNKFSFKEMS
jgi:hypothetical protein